MTSATSSHGIGGLSNNRRMIWPFASRCGGRGCRGRTPGPPRRPSPEPGGAPRRPSPVVSTACS
eukprot:4635840-Prymnesium_polylepis.1